VQQVLNTNDYKTRNRNEVVHGGNAIGDVYTIQKRSVRNAAICKTGFLRMYGIPSDDLQQLLPRIYWNVTHYKLHAGCRLLEKSLGIRYRLANWSSGGGSDNSALHEMSDGSGDRFGIQ
jgi:hypothetical protein